MGWGEWKYSLRILSIGSKWRRLVSYARRPLYPFHKGIGGPQSQLDAGVGIEPSFHDCPACSQFTILAELSQPINRGLLT
jgi:hypothetical protein